MDDRCDRVGNCVFFACKIRSFHQYFKLSAGEHTRELSPTYARMVATICADGRQQTHTTEVKTGKTHYEIALKRYLNNLRLTGSSLTKI